MTASINPKQELKVLTSIPTSIKRLARLVARCFYNHEDGLIIDLLVRHPCLKEDDIVELLKFERKQLRARISTLRTDKIMQMRLKMETGPDGKAQKVNYYYINYKTLVNVVRFRLDMMRKRLDTVERDATSRASFRCTECNKTFTDLEADLLFNTNTGDFQCTYCGSLVEEDSSALPKKDCRLMIARMNETLQPFYDSMREVENATLAPELCEPEPVDINTIRGLVKPATARGDGQLWSGEASRNQGFLVEEARIDISINDGDTVDTPQRKERPIWLGESTTHSGDEASATVKPAATTSTSTNSNAGSRNRKETEDIMCVLLQHEKQNSNQKKAVKHLTTAENNASGADESSDEMDAQDIDNIDIPKMEFGKEQNAMNMSDSDDEADVPLVYVAGCSYPIDKIDDELIAHMTNQEKDTYIHIYQQVYSHMFDI